MDQNAYDDAMALSEVKTTDEIISVLPGLTPDSGNWNKNPIAVKLDKQFETYKEMLAHVCQDEYFHPQKLSPTLDKAVQEVLDDAGVNEESALPKAYMKRHYRDSSLGGNDALNCLPQANEDADLVHPYTNLGIDDRLGRYGMGREYLEKYDSAQRIMYFSFGVPEFLGGAKFITQAIDGELANLMTKGDNFFSIEKLGRLFGATVGAVVTLPFLPIRFLDKVLNFLPNLTKNKATRYYDFKPTMPLYLKMVNVLNAMEAINMNLIDSGATSGSKTGSVVNDKTSTELAAEQAAELGDDNYLLGNEGIDIFKILMKKYKYNNISDEKYATIDDFIEEAIAEQPDYVDSEKGELSYFEKMVQGGSAGLRQTLSYIGFRVEKGEAVGETFSNQYGQSSIAASADSRAQSSDDLKFTFSAGKTGVGIIDGFLSGVKGMWDGGTQSVGIDGLAKAFTGSGRLDIPDIYLESSYENPFNFKIVLSSMYRDPISIFRDINVPLNCLLAGAIPRAIGPNAYTAPFIMQCHCPGLYSSPMCAVNSLTITKGADTHGWTQSNLPVKIEVDMGIIDLSKVMYLTLATEQKWTNILGQNSPFNEYMLTLSGVGLAERLTWTKNLKKRLQLTKSLFQNNTINPVALGMSAASTKLGRIMSTFTPTVDLGEVRTNRY